MSSSDDSPPPSPYHSYCPPGTLSGEKCLIFLNGLPGCGKTTLGSSLDEGNDDVRFYPEVAHKDILDVIFNSGLPMHEILAQFQEIMASSCDKRTLDGIKKLSSKHRRSINTVIIDRCLYGNMVFALNSHYNPAEPGTPEITAGQLRVYLSCALPRRAVIEKSCVENNITVLPVYLWADVNEVLRRLAKRDGESVEIEKYDPTYYNNLESVHFILKLSKTQTPFSKEIIIEWPDNQAQRDVHLFFAEVLDYFRNETACLSRQLKISFNAKPPKDLSSSFDEVIKYEVSCPKQLIDPTFVANIKRSMAFKYGDSKRVMTKTTLHWVYCNPRDKKAKEEFLQPIYGEYLNFV